MPLFDRMHGLNGKTRPIKKRNWDVCQQCNHFKTDELDDPLECGCKAINRCELMMENGCRHIWNSIQRPDDNQCPFEFEMFMKKEQCWTELLETLSPDDQEAVKASRGMV